MKSRPKPEAASAAHAGPDDREESVGGIIDQIDGEAGDDGEDMMVLDAGSRKLGRQTPATRSSPSQTPENQRKPAKRQVISRVRDTKVGHNDPSKIDLTPSKETKYSSSWWVTTVGHKRWPRGLSLRGSIFDKTIQRPSVAVFRLEGQTDTIYKAGLSDAPQQPKDASRAL
jgi:hypothetical protein